MESRTSDSESLDSPSFSLEFYPIFDAHCHLQDYTDKNLINVLAASKIAGIRHIMTNSCTEKDFSRTKEIGEKYSCDQFVMVSYGLHPWWLNERSDKWYENLRGMLESEPACHLGEIGLDALKYERTSQEVQTEIFERQLQLGIELERVVSVHCVRAHPEMLRVLVKHFPTEKSKSKSIEKKANIVMHSYGGNKEMTKKYLKLHANIFFSLSFGIIQVSSVLATYFSFAVVTHLCLSPSPQRAEVAAAIPLENVLIETDSPHQINIEEVKKSPLFCCGSTPLLENDNPKLEAVSILNEPRFAHIMIEFLAKLHNKSPLETAATILSNSLRAFKLVK